MKNFIFLILFIVSSTALSYGQDVTIDNTFGDNGIVVTPNTFSIEKTILTPDNKILSVGSFKYGGDYRIAIAKYLEDGSLDESFGVGGIVREMAGDGLSYSTDISLQPDNEILMSGTHSYDKKNKMELNNSRGISAFVARYKENGQPDSTFGNNGIGIYGLDTLYFEINTVQYLSEDKILIGAIYMTDPSNYFSAFVKLNSNGTIDTTWANNGSITFNQDDLLFNGITLNNDGSFFCFGHDFDGYNMFEEPIGNIVVYKCLADGTFDTSFGDNGEVEVHVSDNNQDLQYCEKLVVLDDGRLLLGGYSNIFVKLLPDGSLDPEFGNNGIVQHNQPHRDFIVQESGSIIVGGAKEITSMNYAYSISRFYANGLLDSAFNEVGYYDLDLSDDWDILNCISIQEDGKVILSGGSRLNEETNYTLVRLSVQDDVDIEIVNSNEAGITIYPNPAKDFINISCPNGNIETVTIFDNLGRQVLSKKIDMQKQTIAFSLPVGIYFCKVATSSGIEEIRKMVVE